MPFFWYRCRDRDVMQEPAAAVVAREAHADEFVRLGERHETRAGIPLEIACKRRRAVRGAQADSGEPLPERKRRGYVFLHHRAKRDHECPPRPDERATCVIYNPAAGRGRAERLLQRIPRDAADARIELRPTAPAGPRR